MREGEGRTRFSFERQDNNRCWQLLPAGILPRHVLRCPWSSEWAKKFPQNYFGNRRISDWKPKIQPKLFCLSKNVPHAPQTGKLLMTQKYFAKKQFLSKLSLKSIIHFKEGLHCALCWCASVHCKLCKWIGTFIQLPAMKARRVSRFRNSDSSDTCYSLFLSRPLFSDLLFCWQKFRFCKTSRLPNIK